MKQSSLEQVFGLVAPIGVNIDKATHILERLLETVFHYKFQKIKLSDLITRTVSSFPQKFITKLDSSSNFNRIDTYMNGGNEIREKTKDKNVLAALAIGDIQKSRDSDELPERRVFIISSFKTPDEVALFRDVYGEAFYLLGVTDSDVNRLSYLKDQLGCSVEESEKLKCRDENEENEYGQKTRNVFQLADAYFNLNEDKFEESVHRVLCLIFSHPFTTPKKDEYGMYLATASSLRSGDLSRQVGAVIMNGEGDIIATGTNDVPKFGGGLYWEGDKDEKRDLALGHDANQKRKMHIFDDLLKRILEDDIPPEKSQKYEQILKQSELSDITEYGRAVHAEMEALLSCARTGVSVKGGTLYCTTFPCHNCAKHIVASGLLRVVFIEPYPKSMAIRLHSDSIKGGFISHPDPEREDGVSFEPFVGVGPRKFIDLFSLKLSRGGGIRRKDEETGDKISWETDSALPRLRLKLVSYNDSETKALTEAFDKIKK